MQCCSRETETRFTLAGVKKWATKWFLGDRTTLPDHVTLYMIISLITANVDFSVRQRVATEGGLDHARCRRPSCTWRLGRL
jgi:hypothetical protein